MSGLTVLKGPRSPKGRAGARGARGFNGVAENFTVLVAIAVGCAMALLVIVGAFRIAGPGPTASFGTPSPVTAATH